MIKAGSKVIFLRTVKTATYGEQIRHFDRTYKVDYVEIDECNGKEWATIKDQDLNNCYETKYLKLIKSIRKKA